MSIEVENLGLVIWENRFVEFWRIGLDVGNFDLLLFEHFRREKHEEVLVLFVIEMCVLLVGEEQEEHLIYEHVFEGGFLEGRLLALVMPNEVFSFELTLSEHLIQVLLERSELVDEFVLLNEDTFLEVGDVLIFRDQFGLLLLVFFF